MKNLWRRLLFLFTGLSLVIGASAFLSKVNPKIAKVDAVTTTYEKTTSISVGDRVLLVCEDDQRELSVFSNSDRPDSVAYSSTPSGVTPLEVKEGYANNTYVFALDENRYLRPESPANPEVQNLVVSPNNDLSLCSWQVNFDTDGNALIYDYNSIVTYSKNKPIWHDRNSFCYSETNYGIYKNIQLYKQVLTYTVSYDGNGASGSMPDSYNSVSINSFTVPTGKSFVHWNTASDDSGISYLPGETVTEDLYLYAIWQWNTYSITSEVTNGSLSSTEDISNGILDVSITLPSDYYLYPEEIGVMMGEEDISKEVTYDPSDGSIFYSPVSGDITITAYCPFEYKHAGNAEDPFTVIEGLQKCIDTGKDETTEEYYVKGLICFINFVNYGQVYNNATYFISDDGSRNNELEIYRGFYIDGAEFTEESAALMQVGKLITVKGHLVNYKLSTKEFTSGSQVVEIKDESDFEFTATMNYSNSIFQINTKGKLTLTLPEGFVVSSKTFVSSDESVFLAQFDMQDPKSSSTYDWKALSLGSTVVVVTIKGYLDVPSDDPNYHKLVIGIKRIGVSVHETKNNYEVETLASALSEGEYSEERILFRGEILRYEAYTIYVSDEIHTGMIPIYFGTSNEKLLNEIWTQGGKYKVGLTVWLLCQYTKKNGSAQLVNPAIFARCSMLPMNTKYMALEFLSRTEGTCSGNLSREEYHAGISDEQVFINNMDSINSTFYLFQYSPYWMDISAEAKADLVTMKADENGNELERMLARYDYIISKYGIEGFITGREVSKVGNSILSNPVDSDTTIILIIAITATSTASLVVLLIIKKRKRLA